MALRDIYIVEGPAGSGKSTLIGHLSERSGLRVAHFPVERPREYSGAINEALAIAKDVGAMAQALTFPDGAIIDRWAVSSFVYSHIRQNVEPDMAVFNRFMVTSLEQKSLSKMSLVDRGVLEAGITYRLRWILVLPSPGDIRLRRMNAEREGRIYPYDPDIEWYYYDWCLSNWHFGPLVRYEGRDGPGGASEIEDIFRRFTEGSGSSTWEGLSLS